MSSLESCRPHIERIYQNLNAQHKQRMSDLHQRLSGVHVEKMTSLRDRARERIQTLKQAMTGGSGSQHHAALSNEVENVRDAWSNRENNPGNLSTALRRLINFQSSTMSGRDDQGRITNPTEVLNRYIGLQSKKLQRAREQGK
jgi:uncharacterized protein YPO0396